MAEPEATADGDEVLSLRAALAVAQAENEQLLQQMARLALVVEQHTEYDPIDVMHGHLQVGPPPAAAPGVAGAPSDRPEEAGAPPQKSGAAGSGAKQQPRPTEPGRPAATTEDGWGSWFSSVLGLGGVAAEPGGERLLKWTGHPEETDDLQRALSGTPGATEVRLDGVGLSRLPAAAALWEPFASTLHTLNLNGNALSDLPSALASLTGLRRLALEGNLLRVLPAPVVRLRALQELWLGCNQLSGLPEAIGGLHELRDLWLVSNEISYLPASFGRLVNLRRLELTANALHELPRAFSRLGALKKLWLKDNALAAFPQQLCALEQLTTLDLEGNRITTLPKAVAHMPALEELRLLGNPLIFPPEGILSQGSDAVLEFIRGHRHADLLSADSERSAQQVAATRDQLLQSLSEAEARADEEVAASKPPPPPQEAPPRPPAGQTPPPPPAQRTQRVSQNRGFFS